MILSIIILRIMVILIICIGTIIAAIIMLINNNNKNLKKANHAGRYIPKIILTLHLLVSGLSS